EYDVTSAAAAGPCDAYLVFRSSLPLYASAVSISNLLNVTATTGGEVVREGDGGAPELEKERAGALRPRHLPAAQVAVAHRLVAPLPLPVTGLHPFPPPHPRNPHLRRDAQTPPARRRCPPAFAPPSGGGHGGGRCRPSLVRVHLPLGAAQGRGQPCPLHAAKAVHGGYQDLCG
ncbi:Os05g0399900, partial [Oryza sativa Japonica Group]